jgi:D-alanyl-D-alanine carboxypeptidase
MRVLAWVACPMLLLLGIPAHAGPLPAATIASIEAAIAQEMAAQNLPGVAVGIWSGDGVDYVASMGKANLETGAARTPEDPFRIGSVTKTMIGTVVLQLAEEGKLALADPIARWFPNFPDADRITVDNLLRMRSGIWDSWTDDELVAYYADPLHPPSMDEMIARAAAEGGKFKAPDTETVYVNLNFILLDKIIADVTGQPTAAVLKSRIFDHLGMTASELPTGVELPGPLRGYGWNAGTNAFEDKTELDPTPVGGAGSVISSLHDLEVFTRALCTGALLSPEAQLQRMTTESFAGGNGVLRYGAAVAQLGPFCGHNGTIMGFSTEAWYLPSKDAVIVINVNRLDADDKGMSSDLFGKLVGIVFPDALK